MSASVLVTRPAGSWPKLAARFQGSSVVIRMAETTVQAEPLDPGPGEAAIRNLKRYDWLVATSGKGVSALMAGLASAGVTGLPPALRVAAVGGATASALTSAGARVDLVAAEASSAGLAARLGPLLRAGARVLVVCPEGAPDAPAVALREAGAEVDRAPLYRTIASPRAPALADEAIAGAFSAVVFTAPSSLDCWLDAAGARREALAAALRRAARVAIGPTTAARLLAAGLPADRVARAPTEEAVGDALDEALRPRPAKMTPLAPEDPLIDHDVKKTPLHRAHRDAGARMVPFAGWDMPVQYTGVIDEHLAVRTKAGLFDVSHMGEVEVVGRESLEFLQHVTCNDVSRLSPGRIQYSALTTPEGTFVDDLLIYKRREDDFLLVINAGNTPKDVAWLHYHAKGYDLRVADVSERFCQIALQGPRSQEILQPLTKTPLGAMKYYGFAEGSVSGIDCIVSRTGYTGEDGFEIYGPAASAEALWYAILGSGAPHGLVPAGLAARDTLRLEAKMALYGNDIDDTTTVLEADLGWILKIEKGDFLGRDALIEQKASGITRKLVGFETEGRAIARHGHKAWSEGVEVGTVTSGTFAPFLKKNIGLVYLPIALTEPGSRFTIDIRSRMEPAVVVPTPFYSRPR